LEVDRLKKTVERVGSYTSTHDLSAAVYDELVRPNQTVTDYRTRFTGMTAGDLDDGINFTTARRDVIRIIRQRRLVGHGLYHDLKILNINHSKHLQFDTAECRRLRLLADVDERPNKRPALRVLAQFHMHVT
jgi:DNA polymerase III epsilon subunit-like protein